MLTSSQGAIPHPSGGPGLRSRKKHRTRLAIQDAALELFAEQGFEETTVEQIAARADVSTATFFRYFKTKSDVVFGGHGDERADHLPDLARAIIERPSSEDDLTAVRRAVLRAWVPLLEPTRVLRQFRAAATSPLLHGLSSDLATRWQTTISDALAQRRHLAAPDPKCQLTAALVMATFSETINTWVRDGSDDLGAAIDRGFELMSMLCDEWSGATRRSARDR